MLALIDNVFQLNIHLKINDKEINIINEQNRLINKLN